MLSVVIIVSQITARSQVLIKGAGMNYMVLSSQLDLLENQNKREAIRSHQTAATPTSQSLPAEEWVGAGDTAARFSKNIYELPAKFEFQIKKYFLVELCFQYCMGHICTKITCNLPKIQI